eukprot:CAMPEP_0183729422 /NCGR_PEP_ID=MMETSP0737-20130205/30254_1 /TAXON_ID=385413 /ORGANISM="Thalassiosira miniscula, Strain CCMP1093" /LENGTH=68 /DNA_ID=CAMNT_0025961599 /DNA_START=1 /DNA_END=204 /DNA_ORIENTATION=+
MGTTRPRRRCPRLATAAIVASSVAAVASFSCVEAFATPVSTLRATRPLEVSSSVSVRRDYRRSAISLT